MKNIIAYEVLKAESSEGITSKVNFLLEKECGWQPVQEVKITSEIDEKSNTTFFYFYQTMIQVETSDY